jgi:hypothetical protein
MLPSYVMVNAWLHSTVARALARHWPSRVIDQGPLRAVQSERKCLLGDKHLLTMPNLPARPQLPATISNYTPETSNDGILARVVISGPCCGRSI